MTIRLEASTQRRMAVIVLAGGGFLAVGAWLMAPGLPLWLYLLPLAWSLVLVAGWWCYRQVYPQKNTLTGSFSTVVHQRRPDSVVQPGAGSGYFKAQLGTEYLTGRWPSYFADALDVANQEIDLLLERAQQLPHRRSHSPDQHASDERHTDHSHEPDDELSHVHQHILDWFGQMRLMVGLLTGLPSNDDIPFDCQRMIDHVCQHYPHGPGLRQSSQCDPHLPRFMRGPQDAILAAVQAMLSAGPPPHRMVVTASVVERGHWYLSWQVRCGIRHTIAPDMPQTIQREMPPALGDWLMKPGINLPPSLNIALELATLAIRDVGGDIALDDQGHLTLVIKVETAHQDEISTHELHQRHYQRHVLVIHHNIVDRNESMRMLSLCGCQNSCAASLNEAASLCQALRFDAILIPTELCDRSSNHWQTIISTIDERTHLIYIGQAEPDMPVNASCLESPLRVSQFVNLADQWWGRHSASNDSNHVKVLK